MTRFGSLTLCITLGSALLACGSSNTNTTPSASDPIESVPLDNAVAGWTVDQEHNQFPGERAMVGRTYDEVTGFIDGAVNKFYYGSYTPKEFLLQNYKNSSLKSAPPPDGATVKLYILQMPSEAQATGLYKDIVRYSDYKVSAGTGWKDPSSPAVGNASRIMDTGSQWWINFRKGVYYVELWVTPSFGPEPEFKPGNTETEQEAFTFAQAIAAKL